MKVAVCYSGLVRNFFDVIDNHENNLLNLYDCDVFFHFWNIFGKTKIGWTKPLKYQESDVLTKEQKDKIITRLSPKKYKFDSYIGNKSMIEDITKKIIYNPYEIGRSNIFNSTSMFYSIYESNKLMLEYSTIAHVKYDVVVRIRSDIVFDNIIPIILRDLTVTVPCSHNSPVNDQFAYGDLYSMSIYSNIFLTIKEKLEWFHPETILKDTLQLNNIKIYTDGNITNHIVREK